MIEPFPCFDILRESFSCTYTQSVLTFFHGQKRKTYQPEKQTQLTWKAFAEYLGVPYRTMQDWQLGNRDMPAYLLRLMIYKIETDGRFNTEAKPEDKRKDMF